MKPAPISDEILNAYVDGELSSHEAAALARRAAGDRAVAARIANLHQFKAGVAGLVDGTVFLDAPVMQGPRRSRLPGWRATAAAVAAALVLGLGASWHYAEPVTPVATQGAGLQNPLVEGHDRWSAAFDRATDAPVAPEWLEGLMQATGLRLVHAAPAMMDDNTVMHYAFVGSNDCRLSLFEQPMPGEVDMALHVAFADDLLSARWQMHGFGYAMIARNMDRNRFTTIAAAVLDVTRIRQPANEAIVASLRAARQRCTA